MSGGVLLALEIVASRVVAPYFGNSVYVWGSLIGVFLAALSLGYYLGGRVATRWPQPGPFLALVLAGGAATYPIPHVAGAVLSDIAGRDLGPRWGPLLGSTALFFVPAVLMATVSPYAVRLKARTVEGVGNVAGILYALSTLGSIAGTLLAAFVLISWLGVRSIIQLLGAVEMALAVLGFVWARRAVPATVAAGTIAVVVAIAWSVPPDGPDVVYARDTVYHRITVSDEGSIRYLRLDRYWQSARDRAAPLRTVFSYTDYLHLPLALIQHPHRVLFVGMGGGTAPARFFHDYPELRIDIVEIDPAVAETALRFFGLPRGPRLAVHISDGRLWLRRTPDRYDLIVLDAYLIDTIPFHLATREFYAEAAAHLTPGGAVAANVIGATRGPASRLFRAIDKTFATVFPAVYVFPVDGDAGDAAQNIIIAGTMGPRLDGGQVRARAAALAASGRVTIPTFVQDAATLLERPVGTADVPVLTDDFAPTDVLAEPRR
ncbi:MAG TPA: fused MFS/spermidine synthase [bacterium]|nr:fused MFS/spermidine synthase [bacterium]